MARLHSVESEILVTRAARDAQRLFRGSVANTARAARVHHLWVLRDWIAAIDGATSRADRVSRLRDGYDVATRELDGFARRFGTAFSRQRAAFIDGPLSGLEDYAVSEGLWTP
jgi:hypothetical protein